MAFSPVWSSLANSPPPPSKSEGATLCEIQAILVPLGLNSGNDGTQLSTQARLATADILNTLPAITSLQQKTANTLDGQHGTLSASGRTAYPSGSTRRSLPRSTSMSAGGSAKSAFLSPSVAFASIDSNDAFFPIIKRAFSRWYQEGWLSALQDLVDNGTSENKEKRVSSSQKVLAMAANILLSLHSVTSSLHGSLHPSLRISGEELIERYTNTRNWNTAPVRCLAWHPHTPKIAVAMMDDSIQVNVPPGNRIAGEGISPVLKYKQQRGVSCMEWRPFLASELAVGCSTGLLIWNVDPCSVVARPSAGCVSHLQSPGHAPVTSISWHSNGSLLLSSSAADTSLILWKTESETKVPLRRMGAGFHMVSWSPNPELIFSATTSTVFRVWYSNKMWTSERWNVLGGHVNSACWSPDGTTLLFTTNTEPQIFCLKFLPNIIDSENTELNGQQNLEQCFEETGLQSSGAAVPVMDLTKVTFNCEDGEEISTGGFVQSMRWNSTGERLVVSFTSRGITNSNEEDISEESGLLCVFSTNSSSSNIVITPLGFIRGEAEEIPITFEFARHFKLGALLTIAWSSGRIQHMPMFFTVTAQASVAANLIENRPVPHIFNETNFTSHLSTSHLLNHSLNALTDFEPQLFSSPTV